MKRRAALVATLTVAAATLASPALADTSSAVQTPRSDTNGCIVIIPLQLAICIPRF